MKVHISQTDVSTITPRMAAAWLCAVVHRNRQHQRFDTGAADPNLSTLSKALAVVTEGARPLLTGRKRSMLALRRFLGV